MSSKPLCSLCKCQAAELGCRCNGEIVLLGTCCALEHYKDTKRHHQSLDFRCALELSTDKEKEITFLDHSMTCSDIQKQLLSYHSHLSKFRTDVKDFKEEATKAIVQVSDHALFQLDSIKDDIKQQITVINTHLNTLDDTGNQLIQKFKGNGIGAILSFYPSSFLIYQKEMLNAIQNMIYLGKSPDDGFNKDIANIANKLENKISNISTLEKQLTHFKREVSDLKLQLNHITSEANQRKTLNDSLELQLIAKKETCQLLALKVSAHEDRINQLLEENNSLKSKPNLINTSIVRSDKMVPKLDLEVQQYQEIISSMDSRCRMCTCDNPDSSFTAGMEEETNSTILSQKLDYSEDNYKDKLIDTQQASLIITERENEIRSLKRLLIARSDETDRLTKSLEKSKTEGLKYKQESKEYYKMEHVNLLSPVLRTNHYAKYSTSRYIYKPGGIYMYQFDIYSKKIMVYNLSTSIDRSFNTTSTCVLTNGDVFIAGFYNPISSEVYIFKVETLSCVKLPNLSIGRYGISLYHHKDTVYAFGGKDTTNSLSTAEKYSLSGKSWSFLPNMQSARCSASCVGTEHKIYLIAGGVKTIEIFDIQREEFQLAKLQLKSLLAVSLIYDEKIYILEDYGYKVLGLDLTLIQDNQKNWNQPNISINNTVYHESSFLFFNYKSMNIEKFILPSEDQALDSSIPSQLTPEDLKDDLRYIYLPKPNTKILSQYDLQYKQLQKIDLSSQVDRNFNSTSTCLLSNWDVFIAGFSSPIIGQAYIYKHKSKTVVKLPDMMLARCLVSLICVGDYVYAFGGETESGMTRTAERFSISKFEWESLPDMNHERSSSACINIDDRIYVIAGGVTSIEEFSLISLNFTMSTQSTYSNDVIGFMRGDEIYILGEHTLHILNKNLETVRKVKEAWDLTGYSINNIITRLDYAVFYNLGISNIEKFCFESMRRKVVIINK